MSKLYVVATPIGNLKEITYRAIDVFNSIDTIYCEDTRVSKKLFNLLEISTKNKIFMSLNQFNEKIIVDSIDLKKEFNACLISDAGYPLISDPGYYLISKLISNDIDIEVVNGPCSIIHSLVVSGFSTSNFYFVGFINKNKNGKDDILKSLVNINTTLVILESCHKIIDTLKKIKKIFGDNVKIVVAKELTKMNEFIYRGNIDSIIESINLKGEFVIVIDNNEIINQNNDNFDNYIDEVNKLILKGNKDKIACKIVAYKYDLSANKLFDTLQNKKNNI